MGKIQRSWRKKLGRRALAKMVRRAGRGSTVIAKAKALELQQAKLISAADAAESRRAERRASLEKQQAIHRAEKEAEKDAADTLTHKTVWRTVQIEVDPKRGLGFYPRNAQTTR